jgi:hypothetical protein
LIELKRGEAAHTLRSAADRGEYREQQTERYSNQHNDARLRRNQKSTSLVR